jgi:hypothetical protein
LLEKLWEPRKGVHRVPCLHTINKICSFNSGAPAIVRDCADLTAQSLTGHLADKDKRITQGSKNVLVPSKLQQSKAEGCARYKS